MVRAGGKGGRQWNGDVQGTVAGKGGGRGGLRWEGKGNLRLGKVQRRESDVATGQEKLVGCKL